MRGRLRIVVLTVALVGTACDESPGTPMLAVPATSETSAIPATSAASAMPAISTSPALPATPPDSAAAALVTGLRFDDYRKTIEKLTAFGDRRRESESYAAAALWVEEQLAAAGYAVEHHVFIAGVGLKLRNTYVTKQPDPRSSRRCSASSIGRSRAT